MCFRVVSWNVNGIRAALRQTHFKDWFATFRPEILCLQEVKAEPHQADLTVVPHLHNYEAFWASSTSKKGYSGVLTLSSVPPLSVLKGIGKQMFDEEGRVITLEYPKFCLVNVYKPSTSGNLEKRLPYKQAFDAEFLAYLSELKQRLAKPIVICGDFNVAHTEIDLARPFENHELGGFTTIEREGHSRLIEHGYIDTFRHLHGPIEGAFTYWNYRNQCRLNNKGWRTDYVLLDKELEGQLKDAFIMSDILGSDHCPVGVSVDNSLLSEGE